MSNELLITVIWTERNCADAPIAKMKKTWIKLLWNQTRYQYVLSYVQVCYFDKML